MPPIKIKLSLALFCLSLVPIHLAHAQGAPGATAVAPIYFLPPNGTAAVGTVTSSKSIIQEVGWRKWSITLKDVDPLLGLQLPNTVTITVNYAGFDDADLPNESWVGKRAVFVINKEGDTYSALSRGGFPLSPDKKSFFVWLKNDEESAAQEKAIRAMSTFLSEDEVAEKKEMIRVVESDEFPSFLKITAIDRLNILAEGDYKEQLPRLLAWRDTPRLPLETRYYADLSLSHRSSPTYKFEESRLNFLQFVLDSKETPLIMRLRTQLQLKRALELKNNQAQ